MFGETVDCPKCGGPFVVEPPRAQPINPATDDPHATDGGGVSKVTKMSQEEWTDLTVHPAIFRHHLLGTMLCVIGIVAGLAGVAAGLVTGAAVGPLAGGVLAIAGGVLAAVAAVVLLRWYLMSRFQSLIITNERVIYRHGLIQRETSEVQHEDIRNLKVNQNVYERLLGYGDIAVSSAGQDDMEIVMNDIPNPEKIADYIRKRQ